MMLDVFFLIMLAIIVCAAYCAFQLDDGYPLWLRLLVLTPFFAALVAIYFIVSHEFNPDRVSLILAVSLLSTYIVIANALSHNDSRWFRKWHNVAKE